MTHILGTIMSANSHFFKTWELADIKIPKMGMSCYGLLQLLLALSVSGASDSDGLQEGTLCRESLAA